MKKMMVLTCKADHKHQFIMNNDVYNFIISLKDKNRDELWEKKLKKIHLMREQIKNDNKESLPLNTKDSGMVYDFIVRYINKNDLFIELGSGNGVMAKYFTEYNYIGLDPIRPNKINYPFLQGIVEALPINNDSLNLCFCKDSLSYYRSLTLVFNETNRVLKKNGYFIITEFVGEYYNNPIILYIRKSVRRLIGLAQGRISWEDTEFKFRLRNSIIKSIKKSNFIILKEQYKPSEKRMYIVLKKLTN